MDLSNAQIDIVVYVALAEEFVYVGRELGKRFKPFEIENVALTCFFGQVRSEVLDREVNVIVVPAGKMGNTRSSSVISSILEKYTPYNVVVIGIAGSLSNDLQPGDVFIPDRVHEYLANAATSGDTEWTFQTSGNHFVTAPRLLNRFQVMWSTQKKHYSKWHSLVSRSSKKVINTEIRESLMKVGLDLRSGCKLHVGDDKTLASGPAVGKGKAFVNWIKKEVDRKVAAMEMESAGVYDAALIRTPAPRAIAIRGISDFADERKDKLEATAKERFRVLAVKNAVTLFLTATQAGLFERETDPSTREMMSPRAPPIEARIRSAFVIGGATDDTKYPDFEQSRLQLACHKLGEVLARAGVHLVVCSPFPDSADLYTVMGYVNTGEGQAIHFHSPRHASVEVKLYELTEVLGPNCPSIHKWYYPGPESESPDAWFQAWLLSQLQALENADLLIAIGGKVSKTANTLLHLAEGRRLPIVPFTFLGGAARRAFLRYDWKTLHPGLNYSILENEAGIGKTIEIANRLITDSISLRHKDLSKPKTFFVSYAKEDLGMAEELVKYLRKADLNVLFGEDVIRSDMMVQASIEQSILKSDVCIVLWNKYYALSPWCYDELDLAINRQKAGQLTIWIFNLDNSLIVPRAARRIRSIPVKGISEVITVTKELLIGYS